MTRAEVVVVNRLGLHARPSARLTATASRYRSEVWLSKGARRVNAKSIMGVMMLAAARGSTLVVEAEGPDETDAVEALRALVASGFEEELG
ncbi:MAG: HPr family phosphocarrier protein [Burkholderiaceae bacterium]|nr:HPr family phosphocarrier protein [Burkholderiaceae bacterium]MCD6674284.1 HPr family phosphocarrier protein [Burkholderiaceae bacterium]